MIVLKNITDEAHKEELNKMLRAHYREIYGENWEVRTPLQKIKDKRSRSNYATERDMSELFRKPLYGTVAFGIINEEDEQTLGFALLDILNSTKANREVETYGQLYQLYIKPEFRKEFLKGVKAPEFISNLKKSLENYFIENGIDEVIAEIPDEIEYLIECGKALGFEKAKETSMDSGIPKSLWERKI